MKTYKYHLAKRGKWMCPKCGQKTFVCYVDDNNQVLSPEVGKCDRADKCNYHRPPRDYFKDNSIIFEFKHNRSYNRPTFKPQPKPSKVCPSDMKQTLKDYDHNHLITFFRSTFGDEVTNNVISKYYIGTTDHWEGSTVFWQIDRFGIIHCGKVMQYDPTTGKRIKKPNNRITWMHRINHQENFILSQCLFGEHLIANNDITVAIVESEKTAMIASVFFADCIVVACGGCGNLTEKMCKALKNRDVVLLPDQGKFADWSDKANKLGGIFKSVTVSNIMEREARYLGDDVGDLFLERYANGTIEELEF